MKQMPFFFVKLPGFFVQCFLCEVAGEKDFLRAFL